MTHRIVGYDIARALAVFGMVVVNFKVVMGLDGAMESPAWLAAAVALLEGRAAATFVILAGVGISLLCAQARAQRDLERLRRERSILRRRALFLFVAGLAYTPIWPADILHFYGVYIALATFVLGASTRRLALYAGLLVLAFVGLLMILDYELGWDFETLTYTDFWSAAGMLRHVLFNGFHPVVPWLAFLLVGMILGRMDMVQRAVRRRVLVVGASVALAANFASRTLATLARGAVESFELEDVLALVGSDPMPPMPLYMLAAGGTACAVIALCVSVGERWGSSLWMRPIVSTGQLALTLYVAHVVLGMGLLEAAGRLQGQSLSFAVFAACAFCVCGVLFSSLWRKRYRRGPLEAAMRRLTDPD